MKDKLLHLLSNTMVTLPVRKTQEGTQVHKGRETFWSLVLVGTNLLATALITSALVNKNIFTLYDSKANVEGPQGERDVLASIFLENIDGSGVKYYKPRFFFAFGLPSLLCHLVGSFLLLLQYKLVHPWRRLGREREANLWGRLGGTKQGLDVEMPHWRSSDAVSFYEQP